MYNLSSRIDAVSASIKQRAAILFLAIFASFVATASFAQSFTFTSVTIDGNQRVEDGTILSLAGISRGQTISAAQLNAASQNIRETGLFETVDVIPQGSRLVITVVERPTINIINVEGNSEIRDAEVLAVVQSQSRRVYTPAQAERDVAAISELYANRGRINASVTARIIERSDNRVDLVFVVQETGLTEVERISFVGNRNFSDGRLRRVLDTKQAGLLRVLISSDTFARDRIAFDQRLLTDFYQSRGYADFQVLNVDVALTRERDAFLITFNVQEGQKFNFGQLTVVSEIPSASAAEFQAAIGTRPGSTYSPMKVENDIARLERLAIQKGIPFVRVEPRITRNDRDLVLDVTYALVRGERIFVERIDIEGNSTTLDRVIRNQFTVVEGDPFNPREIRQAAERIRALGLFANADVNAREGSGPDQVIVDVDVVEAPTGSLSFGGNYNTDTGLGLVASYRQSNFLGRGQSLSFQISTSESNRVASLDFVEPRLLGRDVRFGFSFDYSTTDNQNALYDTETFDFRPSLGFRVSDNGRLNVFYRAEFTDINDVDPAASIVIQNEADRGRITTNGVGYTYSYDTRRTGLNPNAGVLLRFGQEFGVGDSDFIRTTATAIAETKVFNEEVTLRATIEGGLLDYADNDSRVTDRFFLGNRVLRGFEASGIGPRDNDTDDALGGNKFAVARLEAEFPLGLPEEYGITGGVFLDHGSVWDVGNTFGADVLYNDYTARTVAGISIFWTTPIGPLRFNFTEALDAQDRDRTNSFDVTISTSF
ncbi:Beta-barrel assembly machine subunit BamA [Cognatiyoonia sediminum]|uniref:Outer membrane protein assembly factor BamA n=1 Tax=Cognatiyoonia sediminum TaxID=1508389 RepID=A0A1M5M107_9RHOB|nr:outer membrane protein assembly factor BamA [Cognatiyoonia sediminum]SHG70926.1 Beta-barrel assembly machine subunit BamA [Cognatiyoonia sediminum]